MEVSILWDEFYPVLCMEPGGPGVLVDMPEELFKKWASARRALSRAEKAATDWLIENHPEAL